MVGNGMECNDDYISLFGLILGMIKINLFFIFN